MDEQPQGPGGPGAPQYPPQGGQPQGQWTQGYPPRQPAPRKSRAGTVLLVLGVLGACALVAIVVGGYVGWQAYQRANLQKQVKQTSEHLTQASARLDAAGKAIAGVDANDPAAMKRTLGDAGVALDGASQDVTLAREDAKTISKASVAQAYEKSLQEAEAGVQAGWAAVGFASNLADIEEKTHLGLQKANAGTELITAAIGDGNRDDYRAQESKARQASTLFAEAEQLFNDAEKIDRSADLGKAAAWASRSRVEADTIRQQAVAASSGDITAYNSLVDKVNALTNEVNSMEHPPALSDANWADDKLNGMLDAVTAHAENVATGIQEAKAAAEEK